MRGGESCAHKTPRSLALAHHCSASAMLNNYLENCTRASHLNPHHAAICCRSTSRGWRVGSFTEVHGSSVPLFCQLFKCPVSCTGFRFFHSARCFCQPIPISCICLKIPQYIGLLEAPFLFFLPVLNLFFLVLCHISGIQGRKGKAEVLFLFQAFTCFHQKSLPLISQGLILFLRPVVFLYTHCPE